MIINSNTNQNDNDDDNNDQSGNQVYVIDGNSNNSTINIGGFL